MDWTGLKQAAEAAKGRRIVDMLDAGRARDFSVSAGDLHFDYSKTTMSAGDRDLLLGLYAEAGVPARRDAMFSGAAINETEGRAVLHTALRNLDGGPVMVDGADVMPGVLDTLARMEAFAEGVREGTITTPGGRRFHGCGQYRHRRLGSRAGHGGPGAGTLRRWPPLPLHLERGRGACL